MHQINLTTHFIGYLSLIFFVIAYFVVMIEEFTHLRKSKPVILSAAIIWALIGAYYSFQPDSFTHEIEHALEKNVLEFAELFLFLLTAMSYINALQE